MLNTETRETKTIVASFIKSEAQKKRWRFRISFPCMGAVFMLKQIKAEVPGCDPIEEHMCSFPYSCITPICFYNYHSVVLHHL